MEEPMKKYLLLGISIFILVFVASVDSNANPYDFNNVFLSEYSGTPANLSLGVRAYFNNNIQGIDKLSLKSDGSKSGALFGMANSMYNKTHLTFDYISQQGEFKELSNMISENYSGIKPTSANNIKTVPELNLAIIKNDHQITQDDNEPIAEIPPNNNPVPEPATIFMLGLGILGFVGFRNKTKTV